MTRYVALTPIDAGAARAYNPGDPVHEDNVQANQYVVGEQVADVDSDQAQELLRSLGMVPGGGEPVPAGAAPAGDAASGTPGDGTGFDPAGATVDEVNDWLDQHPDQAAAVLAAERAGKHRAGVMHGRHGAAPDTAEQE
jgi:hypothetical protein